MLGVRQLEEAVRVSQILIDSALKLFEFQILNVISDQIPLRNTITGENRTFSQFCKNFCTINEPIRHFYVSF